ncbi:chromodomain-helicase-DNA-binding protein 8-like [Saccostrea echinata]|uniref:chromodomain-helicase-DNA-binding protein 8-like n=1 Tax=Saccostrea echinata TaxID=191078 RepID=UPI002A806E06|nr:chromodomain-helicase-DNA-binding protein 8-like [Saccostrea echinata]
MADDPMLSLFDTDGGSFLDDLTGPGGGQSMDSNFMGQGMTGDQMLQQSQGYGVQMSDMSGNQFNPYQQASPAPEQYTNDSFNQFNASQKLQQMNMNTSHSGMPSSQPMMSPYRQQQFRPTQPNMGRPGPNMGGYGSYGAQQAGPRLPNPQQHMPVQQNMPQWNPGQSSPSRPHYIPQSQNMMQSQMMPTSQSMQTKYLSHRDFPQMPSSNASDFFQSSPVTSTPFQQFQGNSSSNQQNVYIQNVGQRNQMPSVPISSPNNTMGHMQSTMQSMGPQQSQLPMQNQPTFQMQNMGMQRFNNPSQSVPQQHGIPYQGSFPQQQQSMNNVPTSSYQRFTYAQMPSNTPNKQGETGAQFNTSPNQNYRPYPGMPSQRATTPSPHPPTTPEHPSTPQVNPRTPAPIQQMEQLVSPPGPRSNASTPVSSPFHQPPVGNNGPNFQPSNDIQVATSHPNSNGIGPISPNVKNAGNVRVTMTNTEREIQYLQQQLSQLQAAGQTQQTQQKMLEVQEKIRSLRASQEIQRQKAHTSQQSGYSTNGPIQPQRQQPSQIPTSVASGSHDGMQAKPQVSVQQQQTIQQAQTSVQPQPTMQPQASMQQPTLQQQQPQIQQTQPVMQQPQPNVQQQQPASQQPSSNPQQVFQMGQPMYVNQPQPPQNVLLVTSNQQRLLQPQMQQQMPNAVMNSPQKIQVILQPQGNQAAPQMISPQVPQSVNNLPHAIPSNVAQVMAPMPAVGAQQGNIPSSVVQLQMGGVTQPAPQLIQPPPGTTFPPLQDFGSENKIGSTEKPKKAKKAKKQQEKADKIVAEAVARAQAEGREVPKLMSGDIPATVNDVQNADEEDSKKKKKRVRKPKTPKKEKKEGDLSSGEMTQELESQGESTMDGEKVEKKKKPKAKPPVKKKKKPPATFLKKKKRKRHESSESDSELKHAVAETEEIDDDLIQKRRSARNTKRKKYLDDVDLNLSDDDTRDVEPEALADTPAAVKIDNVEEDNSLIVDKILGSRTRKMDKDIDVDGENDQAATSEEEVEEFFVKYKNFSYLHCEWKTAEELEKGDKRIHQKIKRFFMKKSQNQNMFSELDEDELFNPDYTEVHRVLDVSTISDPNGGDDITHFLVKWRGLPYEDATWELQQDVDPLKVEQFYKFREPPEDDEVKPRGTPEEWVKLEASREYKNGNSLRDYQLEGVNWLMFSWHNHQNCILADEMGLGKTIQSITFLNEIMLYGIKGPFLVVVPLSTLGNWEREFETWTDINAIVYHGSSTSRNMLQAYEMFYKDEKGQRIPNIFKFHALITTYEVIISDCELLSDIEWRVLIIDEAHRLKNAKCKLMEGLKMFDCEHHVLLSGTPLQNNTEELHSLLSFLEPERFKSTQAFMAEFGDLKTDAQVEKLKAILKPMMLRRLKEDVEKNLAAKEETIVEVELTNIQKKYYRAILERNFTFLSKGTGSSANVPNLLNTMMELRKCCNHPYLIKGAEDKILSESKETKGNDAESVFHTMVQSCGKMVLLDKLLPKLKQGGHKVLIFSQMIRVLDILEDYLIHKQYLFERLDGRICGKLRQEAIDRFSKPESDRFVFLLCTRAGGLGINLTAADTVIIYDSDWNPQNDLQAQARCHRIGQTKEVKVYRLVTRNSYEREMFDKASLKLGLDKAVLQSMGSDKAAPQAQMSKKEIEELLRKGAYGALMDDDKAGDEFCEEDIDQILQRRTQVIQIESEGKGSTFAKASFSMSGTRTDIDINDPNFWQKWAKKADVDVEGMKHKNELIIQEPRQRKQTTRYGNDDNMMEMSDLDSSSNSDDDDDESRKTRSGMKKRGRPGRKRRGSDDDYDADDAEGYGRSDCFKVEKNLLVYGWGRWKDILSHGKFKKMLVEKDVENISRALLIYSLQQYKGDEKIKEFIWDLISPSSDGSLKNHSGLSAPVPRGRKGKNKKKEGKVESGGSELFKYNKMKNCDPEIVLRDPGYRKHLHRHANKVLLRVRLLYYLKEEIIGPEAAEKVTQGLNASDIEIPQAEPDGDPPTAWWDEEADKSLLIGVYKHGYEKYNMMRQDPALIFLGKCGPPDGAALAAEQNDDDDDDLDESKIKQDDDEDVSMSSIPESSKKATPTNAPPTEKLEGGEGMEEDKLPFPSSSDLNTRLRRIITGFQRNHKRMLIKNAQKVKRMERRERFEAVLKERESQRMQYQQWSVPDPYGLSLQHLSESTSRWSRREEQDFYRVISSFGVEFDLVTGRYKWDRFRQLAHLEKKFDDTLTEYFQAFYHMCMRVCKKFKNDDDALPPNNIYVDPITEERASRCLARIDMLNKIRTETLNHPKLDERVKLCQPSYDLPPWWICGQHDKDLLIGAARHGVVRTDYHILFDPTLSFIDVLKNKQTASHSSSPLPTKDKDVKHEDGEEKSVKKEKEVKEKVKEEIKEETGASKSENDIIKSEQSPKKENVTLSEDKDLTTEGDKSLGNEEEKSSERIKEVNGETEMDVSIVTSEHSPNKSSEKSPSKSSEMSPSKTSDKSPVKTEDGETAIKMEVEDFSVKKETPDSPVKKEVEDSSERKDGEQVKKEEEEAIVKKELSELVKEDVPQDLTSIKEKVKGEKCDKVVKEEERIKNVDETEQKVRDIVKDIKRQTTEEMAKLERRREKDTKCSYEEEELQKFLARREEMEAEGMVADYLPESQLSAAISWPKDRVLFHRLEHICYCVEHNEWPFPKRMSYIPMNYDSRSGTPVGSMTPKDDPDLSQSDAGDSVYDGVKGDGLKMTFHKRRGQGRKYEFEGSRMQQLMNRSAASSDNESLSETPRSQVPGHLSPRHSPHHYLFSQTPAELLNGAGPELDPELLRRSMMEHALYFGDRRGRRGRKRKAEKMAEIAMAEALSKRNTARAAASFEPESRVPVVNLEDGSRLSGDEAPLKRDLDKWLDEHPGYMVDRPPEMYMEEEDMLEHGDRRRGRRPKVDPAMLDPMKLTGEENVAVVNRITGKRITGAKAPPMRYLGEWLEQNPLYDVDPKWIDIVKSKANLPKNLLSRVSTPSSERRRGRPRERDLSASLLSDNPYSAASLAASMSAFPGLGLMSGFGKMPLGMPFGTLPNLGLTNPMLAGFAGLMPGLSPSTMAKSMESETRKEKSPSSSKESSKSKSPSSSQTPHPSFPMLYNPLLFNPLLAAQAAQGLNFSLPTSLPSSFASLAQSGLVNGQGDSDLEEGEIKRYSQAEHREQEMAQDLSVRRKEAHSHHRKRKSYEVSRPAEAASVRDDQDQAACLDLSIKSKPKDSPKASDMSSRSHSTSESPKDSSKTKNKIQGSFKLDKILDTLKDKVNKMEDKPVKKEKDKDKESKLNSILMKIAKEKDVDVNTLNSMAVSDTSHTKCSEGSDLLTGKKEGEMSSEETEMLTKESEDQS